MRIPLKYRSDIYKVTRSIRKYFVWLEFKTLAFCTLQQLRNAEKEAKIHNIIRLNHHSSIVPKFGCYFACFLRINFYRFLNGRASLLAVHLWFGMTSKRFINYTSNISKN